MRRFFAAAAAVAAVLALAFPGVAGAGPRPGHAKLPTPACVIMNPSCAEPVVAQAFNPADDLNPLADFAMTYTGPLTNTGVSGGSVSIATDNNLTGPLEGSQDWTFNTLGFVPAAGTDPPFPFGLSAFDTSQYGSDPSDPTALAEIEYTPFGQDSGFCLTINPSNVALLRSCTSRQNQVFLVTDDPPFLNESPDPYVYALLARHNVSAQRHPCLTAPTAPLDVTGQLTAARCQFAGPGIATDQMWAAIP